MSSISDRSARASGLERGFLAVALAPLAALVFGTVACSGDDGGSSTPIDAAVDAPSIDAFVCTTLTCGGASVDGCLDETHCGDCNTVCEAGNACLSGACACPPSFVPASPGFVQSQIRTDVLPGATLGIGGMLNSTVDALIVGYPTQGVQTRAHGYDLSATQPGTPPFVGAGYDVDLNTFTPSASFYATRGTLTFTRICAGGFEGTLMNAHFVAVEGIMNPTLVPNSCAFDVPMVTFAYGDPCPTPQ